ncbi:MAG: PIN domain-containing protein [Actinobacteria bacterium]|nr:PIN domain-containing protein [Actinomycetota bacterium]
MYLLDTDTLVCLLKGHPEATQNLALHTDELVGTSVITLMELYYGAFKSRQVAGNLARIRTLEREVRVWDLGKPAAEVFGVLKAELEGQGNGLDDFDLAIAACALAEDLTLVTNNAAHFDRVRGLRLENWTTSV